MGECLAAVALSQIRTPERKWKYLSYESKVDGREGWKVQYDGIQYMSLGNLSDAKTCLHALLVKKGVIAASDALPVRAKFRTPATKASKTRGVVLDKGSGQYRGVAFAVGYHATEEDAAAAVRAAIRKRPAATGSGEVALSRHGEARSDKAGISAAELRQRVPCLVAWGEPPLKMWKRNNFPEDIASAARHATISASLYKTEPSTRPLSLQFKYEPVKEAFRTAGIKRMREHPRVLLAVSVPNGCADDYVTKPDARARWLRLVLVATVQHLAKHPWPAEYQANCNRNRERDSGPLRVLHELLVIEKPKNKRERDAAFYLNAGHSEEHLKWILVDTEDRVKESHSRLTAFIATWDPVAAVLSEAPVTCLEYKQCMVRGLSVLAEGNAFRLRGDYLGPWTIRAYLVDLMFAEGRYQLLNPNELTVPEFFVMNGPDSKGHFEKLYIAFRQEKNRVPKSVTEFLCWLKVPGCLLHFLSMWLCFASDRGLNSTDFQEFDVGVWNHVSRKYKKQYQLQGHCAIIAALARCEGSIGDDR